MSYKGEVSANEITPLQLPPLIDQLKNAYKSYIALLGTIENFNSRSDGISTDTLVKNLIHHLQSIQTMTGGAITYEKTDAPLKTQLFEGNPLPTDKIPETNNVLIVGAGPNGLYLAILLKAGNPELNVNVLENRVDLEGRRSLTREQYLDLKALCRNDLFIEVNKVSSRIAELLEVVDSNRFCATRPGLDPFYLIPVGPGGTGIETNLLEYILANRAQGLGVNIFHDKEPGNFYPKYTNSGTLAVFDATGGRLYKDMSGFIYLRKEDTSKIKPKNSWKIQELRNRGSFDVFRGYLPLDNAFRMINDIPYVAVGDTTLKTDYKNGRGIEFNWFLILRYALTFTYFYQRELASAAAGGGGGGLTGGRRRRTRKTALPLKYVALLKKSSRTRRRRRRRQLNGIHLMR